MSEIFCVQDRTGTAAQLVLDDAPAGMIEINDTGVYTGRDVRGVELELDFVVGAVNDQENICITTMTAEGAPGDVTKSKWPATGAITWLTGENASLSPNSTLVLKRFSANAYITPDFLIDYHASRGNAVVESPLDPLRWAIVKGTDYLNQRYRYKGTKLLQFVAAAGSDPFMFYVDPWLIPTSYGVGIPANRTIFSPQTTNQFTEWPRQGVIDNNGDHVYGVPQVIQEACAEAAIRILNGGDLQPDYDPDIVGAGGTVQSFSNTVGPISESKTFASTDLGFFPDIPQIRRMLGKSGVLAAGGGRTVIR